jgi:uncharacterized membrane protein YphA (DoxX/SURF4 family)
MTAIPAQTPAPLEPQSPFAEGYTRLAKGLDSLRGPFLLLIRIYIGYQCIITGWAHLHHLSTTTEYFASLHIPMPEFSVIVSANAELFFGALLLIGFASRIAALVLTINFIVAMLTVQLSNYDSSFRELGSAIWNYDQRPILKDTAFPYLATALIVLFFGAGYLSIDGIIRAVRRRK